MHIIHLAVTLLAAAGNGYAAWLNFAGADSVKAVAHEIGVSLLHRRLERSHPGALPEGRRSARLPGLALAARVAVIGCHDHW